ncbi:MAG: tripartite tricarboxylate transporter substrate binding protein [Hyphomicrobiaceae bacterium]|nr:tripartite tricarboxylate transporter substrate binding protein [Hyphomicrobiaceae bacterium]
MRKKQIGLAALLCGAFAFSAGSYPSEAVAWQPTKPVQLIVGFAPGGGSDINARAIAAGAQECFPTPLVIVNKPGAAGTIAAQEVANAAPDGHTLLLGGGSESTSVPAHRKTPYDPLTDFTPILRLYVGSQFLVVNAKSAYKSPKDLVEAAKAKPGQIAHGSSGVGSLAHSLPLLLALQAGVKFKHVPYQGGAPAIQAVLSEQIDFTVAAPEEIRGLVEAGSLRIVGVASTERNPGHPDVPTLREAGYDVLVENMKGWVGPKGLPDDVVKFHHDCFRKAMSSKAWQDYTKTLTERDGYLDGGTFRKDMSQLLKSIAAGLEEPK